MSVSIGGFDFKNSIFDTEKRHIKGATTEIENEDISFALVFLVESISNSSSSWLINDTSNIESSNGSSILSGLSLGIIEIGWYSDDSRVDRFSKIGFCDFLHLGEDHR